MQVLTRNNDELMRRLDAFLIASKLNTKFCFNDSDVQDILSIPERQKMKRNQLLVETLKTKGEATYWSFLEILESDDVRLSDLAIKLRNQTNDPIDPILSGQQ